MRALPGCGAADQSRSLSARSRDDPHARPRGWEAARLWRRLREVSGGEGGAGGEAGVGGAVASGECWTDSDCGVTEVCIPSDFAGIPGEVVDIAGECTALPPRQELSVITFVPMRFTDDEGVRDPSTDDFVEEEPGAFEITNSSTSFRTTYGPIAWGAWELPYRSPPLVVPFHWQAEFHLRVVGIPGEPTADYDIECNLVFGPGGEVLAGGTVREPGQLLCSEYNWAPPEGPKAPGLLVESEVNAVEVAAP